MKQLSPTWTKNEIVEAVGHYRGKVLPAVTFRIVDVTDTVVTAVPWMREDLQENAAAFFKAFGGSLATAFRCFDARTGEQVEPFNPIIPLRFKIRKLPT